MNKLLSKLDTSIYVVAGIALLSATALLLFSVTYRYTIASLDGLEVLADLLSNISVTADEIPGYLLIWVSFLGAYLAIRDNLHIKCDMFLEMINHKSRLIIELCIEALVVIFFAMLFYLSIQMIMIDGSTEIETAEIAQGYFMLIFPIASILIIIATLINVYKRLK